MFEVIQALAALGYDPTRLHAVPYDFRLTPHALEKRDGYFSSLKAKIELERRRIGKRAVVLAHSMGCKVFAYFLDWVEKTQSKDRESFLAWVDDNIGAYFSNGNAILGSPDIATSIVVGAQQGMPISLKYIHEVLSSSGGILALAPIVDDGPEKQKKKKKKVPPPVRFDLPWLKAIGSELDDIFPGNNQPFEFGPKVCERLMTNKTHEGQRRGSALDFFEGIGEALGDSHFLTSAAFLRRLCDDPFVGDVLKIGIERPPIDAVHVAYGVGLPTRVSTTFELLPGKSTQTEPYFAETIDPEVMKTKYVKPARTWRVSGYVDEVGARERALVNENRLVTEDSYAPGKSGDDTVPYASLSAAHKWLGDDESKVSVRSVPLRKKFLGDEVKHGPYDKAHRAKKTNSTTTGSHDDFVKVGDVLVPEPEEQKNENTEEKPKTKPTNEERQEEQQRQRQQELRYAAKAAKEDRLTFEEEEEKTSKDKKAAPSSSEEKKKQKASPTCLAGEDAKRCQSALLFRDDEPRLTMFETKTIDEKTGSASRTTIVEMEGVNHRGSANHPVYLEYLSLVLIDHILSTRSKTEDRPTENLHRDDVKHGDLSALLLTQEDFTPTDDSDCFWSFANAACAYPGICEYQYRIGDLYLSQSCRLKVIKSPSSSGPPTAANSNEEL